MQGGRARRDEQRAGHEVGATFVGEDGAGNDGAGDAAGTAEGGAGVDEDVRDVLVFAEEREVQQNSKGLRVGSEDDQLRDTTVQRLGGCEETVA